VRAPTPSHISAFQSLQSLFPTENALTWAFLAATESGQKRPRPRRPAPGSSGNTATPYGHLLPLLAHTDLLRENAGKDAG